MQQSNRTALVTGANSGLGYEAAAQLATSGHTKVVLDCRTQEKADAAKRSLTAQVGRDVFDTLAIDTADINKASAAADTFIKREGQIDFLLLNVGATSPTFTRTGDGIDVNYASMLVGHHILTEGLLAQGRLSQTARIVISSSEAARADVLGMGVRVTNYRALAKAKFNGDLSAAIHSLAKGENSGQYNSNQVYADAKTLVTWWAAALARRLPTGMAVFAVSPGAAPQTSFGRNMPFVMRTVMMPMLRYLGPVVGMAHCVSTGAKRYLDASSCSVHDSGAFFASPPGKLVGPLVKQMTPHLMDPEIQEAGWEAIVRLTGGVDIGSAVELAAHPLP